MSRREDRAVGRHVLAMSWSRIRALSVAGALVGPTGCGRAGRRPRSGRTSARRVSPTQRIDGFVSPASWPARGRVVAAYDLAARGGDERHRQDGRASTIVAAARMMKRWGCWSRTWTGWKGRLAR